MEDVDECYPSTVVCAPEHRRAPENVSGETTESLPNITL